jgi:hypothetical protein
MLFRAKKFCEEFGICFLVPSNELTEVRKNEMKEQAESVQIY